MHKNMDGYRWGARAGSLVAGAIPALAFPETNIFWLGFVGLVPLLWLVVHARSRREAMLRAFLGGVGYFTLLMHWLSAQAGPAVVMVGVFAGWTWVLWGWAAHSLLKPGRRRLGPALAVVSAAWVVGEVVRSWDQLGLAWGHLGAAVWTVPELLSFAGFGGVWGLSGLLVAVNVSVFATLQPAGAGDRLVPAVVALALAAAPAAYGAVMPDPQPRRNLRVLGVQAGPIGPEQDRFAASYRPTLTAAGTEPDLVVWAESSVGSYVRDDAFERQMKRLLDTVDAPVLINVDARRGEGGIYKTAMLWQPDGTVSSYDKMRLVPFGEYIPARPLLGWLSRFTEAAAEDRKRGTRLMLLPTDGILVGPLVSFESTYPDMSRTLADMGADVIVIQSATTTWQESWAPEQHAAMAAVRAAETGRPVVHAALSGTSAAFDAQGRRLVWVPTDETGSYTTTVPIATRATPFVRWGDWIIYLSAATVATWVLAPVGARLLSRTRRSALQPQ